MAGGLTSTHFVATIVFLLAAINLISGQFVFPNGETVRKVLSGDKFIVGTTGALYDISMTNGQSQLQRRQLTGPSRLLVSVDEGMYRNLVLNCDNSMCLLVERSNFSQIVWSYPSAMILRESTENSVGIFAISADDTPDLFYVDSPLSNTPARIVRGVLMDINLSGSPANPTFTQVVESTEAVIERDFQFYLEFTDSNFLYLVSDRHSLENAPKPAARVLRFCANDSDSNRPVFRSYFEVKLSCGTGTTITAATFFSINETTSFAQPVLVISAQSETTGESYVCSYSLNSINAVMQAKFDECRIGNGQAGFTRYGASLMEDCRDLTSQQLMMCRLRALYFPGLEVGTNLAPGTLLGRTFLTGEEITSVTATLLQGNFYVFAGSNRGNIHQYAMNTSFIRYIRTVQVETTPTTISHLVTALSSDKLFAFTTSKIIEYEVDQCSLSTTCTDCLSTGDILCGWYTLRSACMIRQSCLSVLDRESEERSVFAEGSTNQCPLLTRATPSVIHLEQLTTAVSITLSTMNVLNHGGSFSYQCLFSFQSTSSSPQITGATANISGNSFTCLSPPRFNIPSIPAGIDHVPSLVTIGLLMPSDRQTTSLVTMNTPIRFVNCSVHTSCASCRGSVVGMCLWCALSFACVSDLGAESRCPNNPSIELTEIPQPCCSANILPSPDSSSGQYLVHANYQYQQPPLTILSEGLDIFNNAMFGCRLCKSSCSGDSVVKTSEATLVNNWVTCDFTQLSYNSLSEQRPQDTLHLQVLVGNAVIDNPNMTSVIVYTCPFLGTNCAQCLTIDSTHSDTFNCTYCGRNVRAPGNCTLTLAPSSMCTGMSVFSTIDDCDPPSVTDFFPKNGPIEGGTVVSITGSNLGTVRSHIYKATIGLVNCYITSASYSPGVSFNCTTSALLSSLFSAPINVYLNFPSGQHMIRSPQSFSYLSSALSNPPAMPNKGPEAGGTLITVVGSNIGIGSSHKVLIRNMECKITTVQTDSITCLTPNSNSTSFNNILTLSVDDFMASGIGFDYEENPVFESIEPKVAFFSGGTSFDVRGRNLDVVQQPRLRYNIQAGASTEVQDSQPCRGVDHSHITCLAPKVVTSLMSTARDINIGLVMDRVTSLLQLNSSVMLHADPTILLFPSVLEIIQNQIFTLIIEGNNFVFTSTQVEVFIDCDANATRCACANIHVHQENNSLVCQVQDFTNLPLNQDLSVIINVGFFSAMAGQVRIILNPPASSSTILVTVITLTGVIIVALGIFIVVVFIALYCKARMRNDSMYDVVVQLQKLKTSSARESKQDAYSEELMKAIPPHLAVKKNDLTILNITLGRGQFGVVNKAYLVRLNESGQMQRFPVAAKMVRGEASSNEIRDFLSETLKMDGLSHPNVINLIGVSISNTLSPILIMPFMENGNLLNYLKKEKSNLYLDYDMLEEKIISVRKLLLKMCHEIAFGMAYLSGKKIIHRDLAARNCLLDYTGSIKVSDFGLSEKMYTREYFRQNRKDAVRLPFKWMSTESLRDAIFTSKSDVWSFGVTCWEIFSCGRMPYPGVDAIDLPRLLDEGLRLDYPTNAANSSEIYIIIKKCWKQDPSERPTFENLVAMLDIRLQEVAGYLDMEMVLVPNEAYEEVGSRVTECMEDPPYAVIEKEVSA